MKVWSYATGVMLAGVLISVADAQQVESVKVRDSIYMLTGQGGNIGVHVGDEATFIVDDQFAPLTEAILGKVSELRGRTPRFVINTHFHGDHTGGNENLGKVGAVIVSHANVRKRLTEGTVIKVFNMVTPPQPQAALPVVTVGRTWHG